MTEEILNEKEKQYLSAVIKPFKDKIKYVKKDDWEKNFFFISIVLFNNDVCCLPSFSKNSSMYKGMEACKEYKLEELGL